MAIRKSDKKVGKGKVNFVNEMGKQTTLVKCPICLKDIETGGNNSYLNRHIDKCLS